MAQPPVGEIGDALVGAGIPAALVGARNMWLPGMFPTPRPRPRMTFLRKVWAYALTIFGGFLALLFGLFFHAGVTETSHREIAWPFLVVALLGLWIAFAGLRRLRWE